VVKPGKRYETEVQEPFRITKACLEPATAGGKVSSVFVECDNNEEFIIANLNAKNLNETIDLSFNEGEKICFKVDGPGTVHMTGNLLDDPPPDGMLGGDWSEEESEDSDDSVEESVATGDKIKEVSEKEAKKILKRKTEVPKDGEKLKKAKLEEMDTTVDTSLGDLDDTDNFAEENDSDDDEDDSDEESDDENTTVGDTTAEMADTTAASDEDEDSDDDSSEDEEEESEKSDSQPKEDMSPSKKKTADTTAACNGDVKTPKDKKIAGSKANETPKTSKDKKNKPMQEDKTKDPEITNDELKTPKSGDVKTQKAVTKTPKTDVKTPKDDVKTPKQELKTPKEEAKTPKEEAKTPKQEAKTPKQEVKTSKDSQTPGKTPKRTLKGGVQVEDLKEGSGPECKPGNMVGMYYEGRLKSNNKKFDALKSGKPFKFKLGSGQVIKGWDVGVLGMKVGGKRKLTIPAQLGYGAQGAPPDIPGNATLVFDIECKFVK